MVEEGPKHTVNLDKPVDVQQRAQAELRRHVDEFLSVVRDANNPHHGELKRLASHPFWRETANQQSADFLTEVYRQAGVPDEDVQAARADLLDANRTRPEVIRTIDVVEDLLEQIEPETRPTEILFDPDKLNEAAQKVFERNVTTPDYVKDNAVAEDVTTEPQPQRVPDGVDVTHPHQDTAGQVGPAERERLVVERPTRDTIMPPDTQSKINPPGAQLHSEASSIMPARPVVSPPNVNGPSFGGKGIA